MTGSSPRHPVLAALEFYRALGCPGFPAAAGERLLDVVGRIPAAEKTSRKEEPGGKRRLSRGVEEAPEVSRSRPSVVAEIRHIEAVERDEALRALRQDIGDCLRCRLSSGRTNVVFGVGNPHARLMFAGEAPGADEDARGVPFVGRAGELLTRMIEAMGTSRDQVYIANIVKCRPPGNRDPQPDEIGTCIGFLHRQIEIVRPEIIVTLGRVAVQALLDTKAPIGKLRGRIQEYEGPGGMRIPVMPTYHPAYLLRSPGQKKYAWEDLQQVMARLGWQAPPR